MTSTGIQNPVFNHVGGWALHISTSDGTDTLSSAWGTVDGVTAPTVLLSEATYGSLVQSSWEYPIGFSNTGSIGYSASGTGGPADGFDSMWVDGTWIAVEGMPCPPGPLEGLYWRFASAPLLSGNGIPHFVGGITDTIGGSTKAYGMFDDTGTPVVFAGDLLPGLPAILDLTSQNVDFDYAYSAYANSWIAKVTMETTDTPLTSSTDEAMVIDRAGLYLDGMIVQEDQPVPAAIGGLTGENWDIFDYMGISEMGDYIFTGDSTAATTEDEFVVVNGMIVAREGSPLDGLDINGAIENAAINENGDWAVIWDFDHATEGNLEVLIFNGLYMLAEEIDDVDIDGDGIADAGARISGSTSFSGTRTLTLSDRDASGNVTIFFTAEVSDNGAATIEGLYKMVVPTDPGPEGDLEIRVSDSPDPLTEVPGQITYAVRVRNNSPAPATGVTVVSTLDPTLVFNAGLSDPIAVHDGSPTGGTVTASIGTMAPYAISTYRFVVDADSGPIVTTTSTVSGNEADTVPGNNDAVNETIVALITDLTVTITDDPDPVITPNGSIVYTVEVTNTGPSDATGVSVTMNLDPTTVFNAGLSDPIAVHNAGVVTADIGDLLNGDNFIFMVAVDTTAQGVITTDATVAGNEIDNDLTDNTYVEETLYELSADLSITVTDDPDPVLPVGGQITYAVEVVNDGPSDATGVTATVYLADETNFVSVDPPGVHTAGVVTLDIGPLANAGSYVFNIVVDTTVAGRAEALGEVAGGGTEIDPDPANNQASVTTLVLEDISGMARGVFSNITGHPTAQVPDLPGVEFSSGCDRPSRSPDGNLWIIGCETAVDEVIIVGDQCGSQTMVQEHVTTLDLGDAVGPVDANLSINDSGQFAFATNTEGATATDEVIVKWDGTQFVTIAREGDFAAPTTFDYSSILYSANIENSGRVWFAGDTTGGSDFDYFVFKKNGNTVEVQEGVTIPTNQAGGATEAWDNFDTDDLWVDGTGTNYILQGDLEGGTTTDDVVAVNNGVVIQEGSIIDGSGFTAAAEIIDEAGIMANGDWFARGHNVDDQDWVLKNGAVLAATGDPLYPGATELYDDAPYSACFYLFAGNNLGDYIIGGVTDAGEDHSNAVLVLNGETVIAREHDPIDLDGNGLMDDGVRVNTFGNDDLVLTDDFQAYVTATMRNFDDTSGDIGDAFIRINLCGVARPCGDINGDYDVDVDDYLEFAAAFSSTPCDDEYKVCADLDDDGLISFLDYQLWLECYEDFNGFAFRGVGPVDIEPADPVRQDEVNVRPAGPQLR